MLGESGMLSGAKVHLLPTRAQPSPEVKPFQNWEIPGNQQAFLQVGDTEAQGVSELVCGRAGTRTKAA